jgi:hypothetical protein
VPVEVAGPTRYVPVPAELTEDCAHRPAALAGAVTNGDVLRAAKAWEAWIGCMDARRAAVRALGQAAPGPSK